MPTKEFQVSKGIILKSWELLSEGLQELNQPQYNPQLSSDYIGLHYNQENIRT